MSSIAPGMASSATDSPFGRLDEAKPNRFQLKIMLVSGMGFFTDAYDLFVIGIVVKIVTEQWSLDAPRQRCSPRRRWPPQRWER